MTKCWQIITNVPEKRFNVSAKRKLVGDEINRVGLAIKKIYKHTEEQAPDGKYELYYFRSLGHVEFF